MAINGNRLILYLNKTNSEIPGSRKIPTKLNVINMEHFIYKF